jgi:hypothetical protein
MPSADGHPTQIASGVQRELDALAVALGRLVSLDNPGGGLLGYSVQGREVDAARVEAILSRRVPDVPAELLGRGSHRPVRVPANPELQMSARTCLPIRQQRDTLALLWVLDDGRPIDLVESRIARACGSPPRGLVRSAARPRARPLGRPAGTISTASSSRPAPGEPDPVGIASRPRGQVAHKIDREALYSATPSRLMHSTSCFAPLSRSPTADSQMSPPPRSSEGDGGAQHGADDVR